MIDVYPKKEFLNSLNWNGKTITCCSECGMYLGMKYNYCIYCGTDLKYKELIVKDRGSGEVLGTTHLVKPDLRRIFLEDKFELLR